MNKRVIAPSVSNEKGFAKFTVQPKPSILLGGKIRLSFLLK
jgi:hypothetical protein